jgi:hypothetical protein
MAGRYRPSTLHRQMIRHVRHSKKKGENTFPPSMFSQRNNPYCDLLSKIMWGKGKRFF